ncbi:DNA-binding protein [Okeania sp. SIO2B9]|uniref:DNA-binding protein n=1 Tax=Okeania sp. SIO2B9 TaxID=2607782 RepID=UPI00142B0D59|nr:DNA-binding protein [Okeania sp. SIO2B9]NES88589.1 helix-turn-helix domain-containing protein [Okeania sp. SIO2B9]
MFVSTTEAASLLSISTQRVRVLLKEGRIQGARKINNRAWVIPLHEGMPRIHRRRKGPKPRWSSHQRCGKNTVHFNRNHIGINTTKKNTDLTVLSVKEGTENLATGHEAEIHGPCRIVYRANKPHSCGATVWIETLAAVTMVDYQEGVLKIDNKWALTDE